MPQDRETDENGIDFSRLPTIKGTGPKKLPPMPDKLPRRAQEASKPNDDAASEDES